MPIQFCSTVDCRGHQAVSVFASSSSVSLNCGCNMDQRCFYCDTGIVAVRSVYQGGVVEIHGVPSQVVVLVDGTINGVGHRCTGVLTHACLSHPS